MEQERKELIKGGYRDRHFNAGSILLAFGVFESVGGGINTWFRTGKLFPGPHLFAGAGPYSFPIYCHCLCNWNFAISCSSAFLFFSCSNHRALGSGCSSRPGDAERQRNGAQSPHCVELLECRPLRLADPHRYRYCVQSLRIH